MYLKSIEVQGFKSFAHKIRFEFHNGITGIVGPNGSGKSNVADAVRWVLGEQKTRQLRSSSMQDVIFSGTETRKPQGFAYVSITLDNSDHALAIDFDEVTVARRIYRSGESEYLLNGSQCRLKDINELFYDTGIGKEGYSIIGQGQIDKILSGRPEDRRELFDEAAGIVKFKRRKAEVQKKLDANDLELQRLGDILGELEKQVGPLKKQAETAREYLRLRDELKRYDANLFLADIASVEKQLTEQQEKESIVTASLENAKSESERLKEDYDRISEEIRKLDETIAAEQNAGSDSRLAVEKYRGQIDVLREQIRAGEENIENVRQRISDTDADLSQKETEQSGYEAEKNELSGKVEKITEQLREAEKANEDASARVSELEQAIEDEKAAIIAALNEKAGCSADQKQYETLLEQAQKRRSELSNMLLNARSDEEEWNAQIAVQEKELEKLQAEIKSLTDEAETLDFGIREDDESIAALNKELNDRQQEYHTSHTKLESLRNLAERYEGYGNSIRRVMEQRDSVRGIRGVVADLVESPKEYEVAVETALGGSIQNIVTDTEETAKRLIGYLKENRFGRATFLPLSGITVRGGFPEPKALNEKGVVGLAKDLVSARKEYNNLVDYLLGRILVVDGIDNAVAIARKYRHSLRIVTLEGELLNPGGSISGGAYKNSSSLLSRKREMDELDTVCTGALSRIDHIQKELVLLEGDRDDKQSELEYTRTLLQNKYIEENTATLNLENLREKRDGIRESSSDFDQEYGELEKQILSYQETIGKITDDIARIERENEERDRRISENGGLLETAKEESKNASEHLSQVQIEAHGIGQRDGFIDENIERVRNEIEKLKNDRTALESGIETTENEIADRQSQIGELEKLIDSSESESGVHQEKIDAAGAEKESLNERLKKCVDRRDELAGETGELDKDLIRLQHQRERLEEKRDSSVDYMWTEYQLTYTTAEELRDDKMTSAAEMKRGVADRREQIRALGPVNVNAIEDYKEVSGRYDVLSVQHADIVAARADLTGIIADLDAGMRSQFSEKFAEIRKEFDRVFKELFGGGHGTLELVEDEDLLEAGVQIISQPPGKKLQNMMQMSGGEKSLTAIALLFAIQNLKPSPFCLLDEIEAALDDSNVGRFANYLKKLSKRTQFIIITHRRGTMVAADRLYGITMQEKGVSALVSVNLIESDLE